MNTRDSLMHKYAHRYDALESFVLARAMWIVGGLAAIIFFFRLGTGSLASWDEAFYGLASRGILAHKDWLTLYQADFPLFNKPPLYMWSSALCMIWWGVNEFTVRCCAALYGIGTILMTYVLGARFFGKKEGLISALVLLSTSHFIIFARRGMLDVPLTFWFCLALYAFWRAQEKKTWFLWMGVFFGCAVMTKGAAGLLIPLIVGVYLLMTGEWRSFFTNGYFFAGWIIGAVIFLPWHIYECILYKKLFWDDYFFYHVIKRSTHAIEGHGGGVWYYVKKLFQKYRPWSVLIPFAWISAWGEVRRAYCTKQYLFCGAWVLSVFVFFSIVPTKLQWYIIPLYPALAILIGRFIVRILKGRFCLLMLCLSLGIIGLHIPFSSIFNTDGSEGVKELMGEHYTKEVPFYSYRNGAWPSMVFYTGSFPIDMKSEEQLLSMANGDSPFFCLMEKDTYELLKNKLNTCKVFIQQSFVLIKKE